MKKAMSAALTILLLLMLSQPVLASDLGRTPPRSVHSEIVYLFNIDEQTLIYQRNADRPTYPASLAKIMTCILALENTPDLRTLVTFPSYIQNYLFDYQVRYSVSISLAGMRAGEEMSMHDLLHGLMMQSANEIAMIIADHIGGSQEEFVEMMNRRARELGAINTHFTNATGLPDPEMVTTARDMAILTRHAMGLPGFMDIVTTYRFSAGPTNIHTSLEWGSTIAMQVPGSGVFYPPLSGVKTGTTPQAGRNFISTATRDGFTYLLVLMNAPLLDPETGAPLTRNYVFVDAENIYEWAFDTFRVLPIVERHVRIHEIPLRLNSHQDFLPLETSERVTALIARGVDPAQSLEYIYELPESIDAPVRRGDHIGYVTLILYGQDMGRVALLAAEAVDASIMLIVMDHIRSALTSFWFRFAVIFIVLIIALYVAVMFLRNKKRSRRRPPNYRPRRRI